MDITSPEIVPRNYPPSTYRCNRCTSPTRGFHLLGNTSWKSHEERRGGDRYGTFMDSGFVYKFVFSGIFEGDSGGVMSGFYTADDQF